MNKIRYGMVGGGPGAFVGNVHRRAINMDGQAQLVAGCFSRDKEKNEDLANALWISKDRCYSNYKEMAKKESERADGIEFVVIVTPNASHYAIAKAFLEVGIHVACDKPLCLSVEEGEELERIAKRNDLLFMVTYTYMGHSTAKTIQKYIEKGKIGNIRTVIVEYSQEGMARKQKSTGWRLDPKQGGKTYCLGDLGTHVENAVSTMTGLKISKVLAKLDTMVEESVLDDNDFVMVEFDNGATGMLWISKIALGHANNFRVRIFGEEGSIEWSQEDCEKFRYIDADGENYEKRRTNRSSDFVDTKYVRIPAGHTEGLIEAMGNLYVSFITCIRAKQNGSFTDEMIEFPTVSEGVDGMKFIDACVESSQKGNVWIEV